MALLPVHLNGSNIPGMSYDVAPDGRFLLIQGEQTAPVTRLHVVLNWFEELKRRVPPAKNQ